MACKGCEKSEALKKASRERKLNAPQPQEIEKSIPLVTEGMMEGQDYVVIDGLTTYMSNTIKPQI